MAFVHRNFIRLKEHRVVRSKPKLLHLLTVPNLVKVSNEAPRLASNLGGMLLEFLVEQREHVVLEQIFLF